MKLLRLTAPIELQAAADGKPPRVRILAYGGGTMKVNGWGSIAVEMSGLTLPSTVPLLASHENTLDAIAGQGTPKLSTGQLVIEGNLAPGKAGDRVQELLAAGVNLQASIGAEPVRTSYVQKSGEVKVNGRDVAAGTVVIHAATLRECSILPVGADGSTSVSIAARAAGDIAMNFDTWIQSLGVEVTDANRGRLEAEHQRLYPPAPQPATCAELEAALKDTPLLARAMGEAWTLPRAREEKLTYIRASRPSTSPSVSRNGGGMLTADNVAVALVARSIGEGKAEKLFKPEEMEAAKPLFRASFVDLIGTLLRAKGIDAPRDRHDMIRAAVSGGDLSTALGNVANKVLESSWMASPPTWQSWAAVRSAANFNTQTSIRPSFAGALPVRPRGGSLEHQDSLEETIEWKVHTFAKVFVVDYEDVVDDNVSAFSEVLPGLGKAARTTLSNLVYYVLMANADSHFHADNDNLQTNAALSSTKLADAIELLRMQTDPHGNLLDLRPNVLCVPPTLEQTARELLNSSEVLRVTTDLLPTGNAHQGVATLEVEARLQNGVTSPIDKSLTVAGDENNWYLFASPADAPLLVGFLNGQQTPQVQSFGMGTVPDRLEMSFRVVHVFGAALGDHRAGVKSEG